MNFRHIGGRRYFLCLAVLLVCTVLVWFGKIDGQAFGWVVVGTVGAYITGNVVQKRSELQVGTTPAPEVPYGSQ